MSGLATGCAAVDFWTIPLSEDSQYEKGLVVLYPGSANLRIEMSAVYEAIRAEGHDLAIEETIWGTWLEHFFEPQASQPRFAERAAVEAARLSDYKRTHPDAPVTLVTFSGGAHFAFLTAAAMPDDVQLSRIITLSPGVGHDYDLLPALEHLSHGIVNYWSPLEYGPTIISNLFGLADGRFGIPAAASTGFQLEHAKLVQISWTPEMRAYGNNGEHLDYFLNVEFLRAYIVPWVVTE